MEILIVFLEIIHDNERKKASQIIDKNGMDQSASAFPAAN